MPRSKNGSKNESKNLGEMGTKCFGGLNQKSGSSSISGIQSSNSCKKNHGKILIVAEVIRRLVTDTLGKPKLRYGHLCGFLEAEMIISGPIEF